MHWGTTNGVEIFLDFRKEIYNNEIHKQHENKTG